MAARRLVAGRDLSQPDSNVGWHDVSWTHATCRSLMTGIVRSISCGLRALRFPECKRWLQLVRVSVSSCDTMPGVWDRETRLVSQQGESAAGWTNGAGRRGGTQYITHINQIVLCYPWGAT